MLLFFLGWYFLCLLSVHLNVIQYVFSCPVHLFHLCTLVYCVVFTEVLWKKKEKEKRCLLKEVGVIVKVLRMTLKEWKEK